MEGYVKRAAVVVVFFFSATVFQPVISALAAGGMLGQVAATGVAEYMTGKGTWSRVERVFPVSNDSRFRTADGRLSFVLKEGTRIEAGDRSEIELMGTVGSYTLRLAAGKIVFTVPGGSSLLIETPDMTVEVNNSDKVLQKVSSSQNSTVGGIFYDGKKTRIATVSGKVRIKTISGESLMELAAGQSVEVFSDTSGILKIIPVQAVEENGTAEKTFLGMETGLALFLGFLTAEVAGGVIAANEGGGKVASPASP